MIKSRTSDVWRNFNDSRPAGRAIIPCFSRSARLERYLFPSFKTAFPAIEIKVGRPVLGNQHHGVKGAYFKGFPKLLDGRLLGRFFGLLLPLCLFLLSAPALYCQELPEVPAEQLACQEAKCAAGDETCNAGLPCAGIEQESGTPGKEVEHDAISHDEILEIIEKKYDKLGSMIAVVFWFFFAFNIGIILAVFSRDNVVHVNIRQEDGKVKQKCDSYGFE
jgi:hypothetical protein